jgi:hypothetical protein
MSSTMKPANGSEVAQVGGNHYQSAYQHWDWAEEVGLGPMEYAATKYITRWYRKDGLQDLKKARSYVAKLMELVTNKNRVNKAVFVPGAFNRFCTLNQVVGRERDVCLLLNYWHSYRDLEAIHMIIGDLIFENFPEEFAAKVAAPEPSPIITYTPGDQDEPKAETLL